jgi:hypothetical protein
VSRHSKKALGNPLLDPVPCPPSSRSPFVRLLYPREGVASDVVAVGNSIHGVLTHFANGQPVPHYRDPEQCDGCRRNQTPRWNGYLACIQVFDGRRRILVITEGAYRNCKELQQLDGRLRGYRIRLERMGRGRNAPVKATISAATAGIALPADWSVTDSLTVLWRIGLPQLDHAGDSRQENPFQQRQDRSGRDERGHADEPR